MTSPTSPTSRPEQPTAPYYAGGQWTDGPDLIRIAWAEGPDDHEAVMRRLEYEQTLSIGQADVLPMIEVWERSESPRFALLMEAAVIHNIYTDTVPDLWDLLARWAPVVRDSAITDLLYNLTTVESGTHGTVETIARRAGWGAAQPYKDPRQRR